MIKIWSKWCIKRTHWKLTSKFLSPLKAPLDVLLLTDWSQKGKWWPDKAFHTAGLNRGVFEVPTYSRSALIRTSANRLNLFRKMPWKILFPAWGFITSNSPSLGTQCALGPLVCLLCALDTQSMAHFMSLEGREHIMTFVILQGFPAQGLGVSHDNELLSGHWRATSWGTTV